MSRPRTPVPFPYAAALLLSLLLAGCGGGGDTAEESPAAESEPEETVFDDMIETQDKARAVEDITQAQKKALDEAIEEQTSESGE